MKIPLAAFLSVFLLGCSEGSTPTQAAPAPAPEAMRDTANRREEDAEGVTDSTRTTPQPSSEDAGPLGTLLYQSRVIAHNAPYIRQVALRRIGLRSQVGNRVRQSQWGGHPALPPGVAWPTHPEGTWRFVMQVNLAEFVGTSLQEPVETPSPLPASGLLAFFVLGDDDESVLVSEVEAAMGIYTPADVPVERRPGPGVSGVPESGQSLAARVSFDLPRSPAQRTDWPDSTDARSLTDWWKGSSHCADDPDIQLLGYPMLGGGIADAAYPDDSLIHLCSIGGETLASGLEPGWFHTLHIFIEAQRLAERDFTTMVVGAD